MYVKKVSVHVQAWQLGTQTEKEMELIRCGRIKRRADGTGREYVTYTKDEIDEKGRVTIYTSEVIRNSETETELKCVSEDEWSRVRTVLRQNCTDNEDVFGGLLLDSEGFEFI